MSSLNVRFLMSLLLVLILTILPLPSLLAGFRPLWVLMFVLYIQFFMPSYYRVTWLFFIGLTLDILLSSVIGEHACALLLTSGLAGSRARRFTFFSIIQQMVLVTLLCIVYQAVILLVDASLGYHTGFLQAFETVLISVLCWPWIKILADNLLLSVERYH